jgi:sigma-B regulation protein RsbU (phosphoserine phosphatase)
LQSATVLIFLEVLLLAGAILFLFTGSRVAYINRLGSRADALALAALLCVFAGLHYFLQRRIVPAVKRRRAPQPYDERRILLDMGEATRRATNVSQLYKLIVGMIADALRTERVSIFVREDSTGDFVCRMSSDVVVAANETPPPLANQRSNGQPQKLSEPHAVLPSDAFVVKRLRHLAIPLKIEEHDLETWMRALSAEPESVREERARECLTLEKAGARLLLQIKMKDQLVGILSLGRRAGAHEFSAKDKEMLMSVAGQLALIIENSKLAERMVEEERLRRELSLAAEVQQKLFPENPPATASLELAALCQPARMVGGDYYDFIVFDNKQLGIAVADVAGKGISAALLMSTVQASLRSQAMANHASVETPDSIAALVSAMNRLLCRSTGTASYVTFFYAQYDESTARLTYVNAGHNPPLLVRAAQQPTAQGKNGARRCTKLTTGGLVIGLFEDCRYVEESIELHSGDLILAYTDGVSEALNIYGEEFGEDRLEDALVAASHLSVNEIRDDLMRRIREWCAGAPQHDDSTLVLLKVK